MSERITRANLEGVAGHLTDTMRAVGIITDRQRVVLSGAYGGWMYAVTGATIEDGTGQRTGVAGLQAHHDAARKTWENGCAVLNALRAARMAHLDAVARVTSHAFHDDGEPCELASLGDPMCQMTHAYGRTWADASAH